MARKASTKDSRSVSTDALETLGTIHERDEHRDAIHIAVEPVEAGESLKPGEHITIDRGIATGTTIGNGIAIVDPYLVDHVQTGQRFWALLYPRTIKSLRHVWSHPGLPDEPALGAFSAKSEAEAWIRQHADAMGLSYGALLEFAGTWLEGDGWDGYRCSDSEHERDTFDAAGFWPRYALVTGKSVPEDKRHSFFTCAC